MTNNSFEPEHHAPDAEPETATKRLEEMPPEIGFLLIGFGVVGLVFPGPFGTPLIVAGGLSLWPKSFRRIDRWMLRKMPKAHASGHVWVNRFMDDLDSRYPETSTCDCSKTGVSPRNP